MKTIYFLVQGSQPEPYEVIFKKKGDNITASCTCPAGQYFMHCKHRVRILEGITEGIVSDNIEDAKIVHSWLPGSDVEVALNKVKLAEKKAEDAKLEFSNSKKMLAQILMD